MRTRLIGAALFVPIVLVGVWLGGPAWAAMVALASAIACFEAYRLASKVGPRPTLAVGIVGAPALVVAGLWPDADLARPIAAAMVVAAFAAQLARPGPARSPTDWAVSVAVPTYVGILAGYVVMCRTGAEGLSWCLLLVALVWTNDSLAYVGGRLFGRHALAPAVSPKKTVEGAAIAALATVALAAATPAVGTAVGGALSGLAGKPAWAMAALGLAVSIASPAGDLAKSLVKRAAGAKDAGRLIPGHGGLLDRIDGLLFAAPLVYYASRLLGGRP